MDEGEGSCVNFLKRGWNKKVGRGNKDFKKGGKAGSRGGCLKKGGLEPPYELCTYFCEEFLWAVYVQIKLMKKYLKKKFEIASISVFHCAFLLGTL